MIAILAKLLTGGLLDRVLGLYDSYIKKEISEAEFRSRVEIATQETEKAVETAWADAAAKMADSVQATVRVSPVIQRAYAAVMFLQLAVLSWYQIGAPAFQVITGTPWPHPGIVIEWSYALLAVTLGAGPLVLRR